MSTIICPKCGLRVRADDGECFACGARLPRVSEKSNNYETSYSDYTYNDNNQLPSGSFSKPAYQSSAAQEYNAPLADQQKTVMNPQIARGAAMKDGSMMTRQELITALTRARANLGDLVRIDEEKIRLNEKYLADGKYYTAELATRPSFILSFFLCYLVSALVFIIAGAFLLAFIGYTGDSNVALTEAVLCAVLFSLIYAGCKPSMKRKKFRKKIEKCVETYAKNMDELELQRQEYVSKNTEIFGFLPPKYASAGAISTFLSYLEDMRADNLKEAINLYEKED